MAVSTTVAARDTVAMPAIAAMAVWSSGVAVEVDVEFDVEEEDCCEGEEVAVDLNRRAVTL